VLKAVLPANGAIFMVFGAMLMIIEIIGLCLAAVGLSEYGNHAEYTQGKKQAIGAIIISLLMLIPFFSGVYSGIDRIKSRPAANAKIRKAARPERIFKDLNFQYPLPAKPYVEVDVKSFNPDATLVVRRTWPEVYFMIIAERGGIDLDMDNERLYNISKANLASAATSTELLKEKEYTINGMKGVYFCTDVEMDRQKFVYVHWIYSHNGFWYQLITMGFQKDRALIYKQAKILFSRFKQIDANLAVYSEGTTPFRSYTSPKFAYSLDLKDTAWLNYNNISTDYPAADTGGTIGDYGAFLVVPIIFTKERPHLEAITQALLKAVQIPYPHNDITNLTPIARGDMEGYELGYSEVFDGTPYTYKIRILAGNKVGYLVSVYTWKKGVNLSELYDRVISGIVFNPAEQSIARLDEITRDQKEIHADHYNRIGLFYFDAKQYTRALTYFKQARSLNATEPVYLTNCMEAYNRLKRYDAGLEFLETHLPEFKDNHPVISWHAWFLSEANQIPKALDVYKNLFSTSYRHDEDFINYVHLLAQEERFNDVKAAFEQYFKAGDSLTLRMEQARLLYQQGEYESAVTVLKKQQENLPYQTQIAYALIQNYNGLDQPKNALEIADQLIAKQYASADTYYYKGKAEYQLKWYRRAKQSFEKALQYAPADEDIQYYIREVSAVLGEGQNTDVKEAISPVALPETLMKALASLSGDSTNDEYNSYYLARIRGIGFQPGKELKYTTFQRIKVMDASGISLFSTIEIDFNPLSEKLFVNKLIVWDSQGNTLAQGKPSDYYIIDKQDSSMATYAQTLNITVPHLAPGNIIELVYTRQKLSAGSEFIYFDGLLSTDRPIQLSAIYYNGDPGHIRYKSIHAPLAKPIENGLLWMMKNPPVYQWEPEQINYQRYLPIVRISCATKDWQAVGNEYLSEIKSKLSLDDQTIRFVKNLVKGRKSQAEKIEALINYVQSNYTYKAIEFGRRSWIPNTAAATIENKYGDCKDHAVLLHEFLNVIGVTSYLTLVHTESEIEPGLPSMDQFNHMIVFIPNSAKGRFVDTTDKDLDLSIATPSNLGGRSALVLSPDNIHIARIPAFKSENNMLSKQTEIDIRNNQDLLVNDIVKLSGYCAAYMRGHLKTIEKVQYLSWAQRFASNYQQAIKVKSFQVANLYDNQNDLVIELGYEVIDQCDEKDNQLLVKLPSIWEQFYIATQPIKQRRTPFEIYRPFKFVSQVKIKGPNGFVVLARSSEALDETNDFGRWRTTVQTQSNVYNIASSISLNIGVYEPNLYADYHQMTEKVIRSATREFHFVKR
jgi:tetratricopeptide (TPR) repeat protein/transglutaminase-like putative cysteine protease